MSLLIVDSIIEALTGTTMPDAPTSNSSNHDSPEYNIWGQPTNDAARDAEYRSEREASESSKSWWD